MKIEDISKIYDFLGSIRLLGFLSLVVILAIVLWILISPYKTDSGISKRSTIFLILIVVTAVCILYADARNKTRYLQVANFIKQDLM